LTEFAAHDMSPVPTQHRINVVRLGEPGANTQPAIVVITTRAAKVQHCIRYYCYLILIINDCHNQYVRCGLEKYRPYYVGW